MPKSSNKLTTDQLGRLIYEIHGERVMLDSDLASIYGVETNALNRAVKRNRHRFPKDFVFQLTQDESELLRRQIGTLKNGRGQHRKYLPWVSPSTVRSWQPTLVTRAARAPASYPHCISAFPRGSRSRVFSTAHEQRR